MRSTPVLALALALAVAACGGDDDATDAPSEPATGGDAATESDGGGSANAGIAAENSGTSGGAVVNPQPAGQALVSVDGQEWVMTEPGGLDCELADDRITFSFRIGDNEVTLGAGANRYDGEWIGAIDVRMGNPDGEGAIAYFPELPANSAGMAVDGDSFSYSGPMKKQPPNDGSNPPPIDVGDGLVSITCP